MKSRVHALLFAGDRQFVTLRGLSMFGALVFALVYSKQLGVERRGLLTFVMMTNLVFTILLISGISLHLRNTSRKQEGHEILGTYLSVVFFLSLITPVLNWVVLKTYQEFTGKNVPNNLLYVCVLYCFFATLSYGLHDALLLIKSLKIASVMDLGVVVLQILGYVTLLYSGETSYFVSILISISVSYLVMAVSTVVLLVYVYNPKLGLSRASLKKLFLDSSTPTLVNMTNQLLERVDKVFIGIQTSAPELARFSTSQSILGTSRFLFDALAKLSIARDRNFLISNKPAFVRYAALIVVGLLLALGANQLVNSFLGSEWNLSFLLVFAVGSLEILKGVYSLVVMNSVRSNNYIQLKRASVAQLIVGLILQPTAIHFFGLWGSIISTFLIISIGFGVLKKSPYE